MLIQILSIHITCVDVLGPGPLGAPGPRCSLRVVHVTTYCQASYLQSGMHPTEPQTCTQKAQTCTQKYPQTCTQLPHTLHPTSAYFAPNRAIDMHPKGIDFAPKSSRIHAPKICDFLKILKVCRMTQDLSKSVPMVFRSPGKPLIKLFHFIFN